MQYIGGKAERANRGSFHETALKNSGMYEMANGDKPFETELPAVEYVIGPEEVENSNDGGFSQSETGTDPNGASEVRERKKSFVGLFQYPANAHYNDRSRPTQDHMKIDMFQYEAPQKYLAPSFENFNQGNKEGNIAKERFNYTALSIAYPQTIPFTLTKNLYDRANNKTNVPQSDGANDADANKLFADTITGGLQRGTNIKKYLGTV